MKNIYRHILDHLSENSPLVLATVTKTQGSTPQKPGSAALIGNNGLITGTVGGGIVEGKILTLAHDAISSGKSGYYNFDLANNISKSEEAICGGQISVLLDPKPLIDIIQIKNMQEDLINRVPGVMITSFREVSDNQLDINRSWISENFKPDLPETILNTIEPVSKRIIEGGKRSDFRELDISTNVDYSSFHIFLEPVFPPDHLVIIGAGHIGKALAHFGVLLDFEVTVIDDRSEYANAQNIPDADHIIVKNIGDAVAEINMSDNNYIVIVTRGHSDDASALRNCIGSDLPYIGMIGSKKKIAAMRDNFIVNGWATEDQWNAIHAPIGIEIESQTVEEIAISIAAQLIKVRNSIKG